MYSERDHKTLVALLRGQVSANTLKALIANREISSASTEPLINTILDSFSLALSFMDSPTPLPHHESFTQNMAGPVSGISSLKKKICQAQVIEHYIDDSPTPLLDDGFSWRKYGQKTIKTSPHQRCYFRCTYAKEKNCKAAKRVQKIKDNPPVYRTTYVGKHTCEAPAFAVFTNNEDTYGSKMIEFDKCDHVMSESVTPQVASIDHQAVAMEDKATDHIMNQECDDNEFLVDVDNLWACYFPPLSPGDLMFFDNT
ncbi:unnamed protein product [Microthlaspi erraticum]|uniref:WRKY domain-containing protein n=1 Tax=Microthlaspi erraticum TaxID=1685480 RepID=A0A6D2HZD4_9BRAS|nr:unnamed protein product [Microthlaspi erraticum]